MVISDKVAANIIIRADRISIFPVYSTPPGLPNTRDLIMRLDIREHSEPTMAFTLRTLFTQLTLYDQSKASRRVKKETAGPDSRVLRDATRCLLVAIQPYLGLRIEKVLVGRDRRARRDPPISGFLLFKSLRADSLLGQPHRPDVIRL